MHVTSIEGVDDMILLGDLKESAILHNLHMRYKQNTIYVNKNSLMKIFIKKTNFYFFRPIPDQF